MSIVFFMTPLMKKNVYVRFLQVKKQKLPQKIAIVCLKYFSV